MGRGTRERTREPVDQATFEIGKAHDIRSYLHNHRMRIALPAIAFAVALAAGCASDPSQPSSTATQLDPVARLEPCEWQEMPFECGTLEVPEDHASPGARTISLSFVVARATGEAVDDPVFYFSGGPGTAASRSARGLVEEQAELRRTRDFVFLDQRGTGRSTPLACQTPPGPARLLEPIFDREETAACRAALESAADLRKYTTADAARDLDLVRRALGYERLNLIGTSYGTRMAWTYAAMFPAHARTLLLVGPVPPGFHVPLPFARGLDVALDALMTACEADAACHAAYPSLRRDTDRAFERLREGPAPVRVIERVPGGEPVTAETVMTYGEFAESVRYRFYVPQRVADLPLMLTRAAAGDYGPIAETATANRRNLSRAISQGMYLSVTCAEDIPFISDEAARAASEGTRLGDYRLRQQREACAEWPRGEGPHPSTAAPVATPALVEAGVSDPATPLVEARAAMALLPNGRLIEVPHGGHSLAGLGIDPCLVKIERQFIERGDARGLDTSCVASARRPPFVIDRP